VSRRARLFAAVASLAAGCVPGIGTAAASDNAPDPTPRPNLPGAAPRAMPPRAADFAITGQMQQGGWIRGKAPTGTISLTLDAKPLTFAPDGSFFAAFDRDAGSRALLVARRADGSATTRELAVLPRGWKIERIGVARRAGGPTEAFMALRKPELARINAARAIDSGSTGWRQAFLWPVRGRISGMFGSQRIYLGEPGAYHSGIDIATGTSGTPFAAPADGVIILAAKIPFTLEGHLLMIDHGMGLNSAFLHCSQLLVDEGDHVRQGQLIGRIGATGRATGPHLHWSMKWHDARIDPILLTGPMT
jgi:murein DD-endopeptidase MepM/ murein hydrolase activator NlpD